MKGSHRRTTLAIAALAVFLICGRGAAAQSINPGGARVYLPRLRRMLSFGGVHNKASTTVIASLDLGTEWPVANPAITVSATKLSQPVHDAIPVVTRRGGAYDIMLYGGSSQSKDLLARHMMSTPDGVKLDGFRATRLLPEEYFSVDSTRSTTAAVWDEVLPGKADHPNAPAYMVGGVALGVPENRGRPAPSNLTASIAFDKPAETIPLAELLNSGPGPSISAKGGVVPISFTELMVAGGTGKSAPSENITWLYTLESNYWYRYQGRLPSPRSGNQLTTYSSSSSGRFYVISVGSDQERPDDFICYSDTSTQSHFAGAGPIQGLKSRFIGNHSVVTVGDQLMVVGGEYNPGTDKAEAFQVVLFKIQEPTPGKLTFTLADKFTPLPRPPGSPAPHPATDSAGSGSEASREGGKGADTGSWWFSTVPWNTWVIVGSSVGVFVVTVLIALLLYRCVIARRRKRGLEDSPAGKSRGPGSRDVKHTAKDFASHPGSEPGSPAAFPTKDFFALALPSPMVVESPCTPMQLEHQVSSSMRRRSMRSDGTLGSPTSLFEAIASARPDLSLDLEEGVRSELYLADIPRR